MKKTLLLVIDSLAKGGAEVLLVGILPELNKRYEVILVTLKEDNHFSKEGIICKKKYTLGFTKKLSLFLCVWKLKKIIKKHSPSLIHSHLFYSSLIARMACPVYIPLIYSLHNEMSKNVFDNSKTLAFFEKKTIKENHALIAVSQLVLSDYEQSIGIIKPAFVLPNFISDQFFIKKNKEKDFSFLKEIKLVAVGNIKNQKNYSFLLQAFELLKKYPVSLDIYGEGNDKDVKKLLTEIDKQQLPVILKGGTDNIHKILPQYDLYVSCSSHEGFGIAAVEAMAAGLPLLLSDIPVFREVTSGNALFFDIRDPSSFVDLITEILKNKHELQILSNNGIGISKKYTKEIYLDKLFNIYRSILQKPISNPSLLNA